MSEQRAARRRAVAALMRMAVRLNGGRPLDADTLADIAGAVDDILLACARTTDSGNPATSAIEEHRAPATRPAGW